MSGHRLCSHTSSRWGFHSDSGPGFGLGSTFQVWAVSKLAPAPTFLLSSAERRPSQVSTSWAQRLAATQGHECVSRLTATSLVKLCFSQLEGLLLSNLFGFTVVSGREDLLISLFLQIWSSTSFLMQQSCSLKEIWKLTFYQWHCASFLGENGGISGQYES